MIENFYRFRQQKQVRGLFKIDSLHVELHANMKGSPRIITVVSIMEPMFGEPAIIKNFNYGGKLKNKWYDANLLIAQHTPQCLQLLKGLPSCTSCSKTTIKSICVSAREMIL